MDLVINENALERPTKVVKADEVESIKCSNCNEELLKVKVIKAGNDTFFNIVVECPFCNDKSFLYKVDGLFHYMPIDHVALLNVEEKDNNTILVKTKRR